MATNRTLDTLVFLISGVFLAAVAAVLSITGSYAALSAITVLLAPTSALAFGLLGMNLFGRDDMGRKDSFVTMNVSLALGLVILTLAEIAKIAMNIVASPEQLYFTVGLVQMPGLLLWGLGIISYLKSVNLSVDIIEGERLWPVLVFVAVMGSLTVAAAVIVSDPERSPLAVLVSAPTVIWLGIILSIVTGLSWLFRGGLLVRPFILLTLAMVLGLIRSLLWIGTGFIEGSHLDSLLAIELHLLVGTSLVEAAKLEMPFGKYEN